MASGSIEPRHEGNDGGAIGVGELRPDVECMLHEEIVRRARLAVVLLQSQRLQVVHALDRETKAATTRDEKRRLRREQEQLDDESARRLEDDVDVVQEQQHRSACLQCGADSSHVLLGVEWLPDDDPEGAREDVKEVVDARRGSNRAKEAIGKGSRGTDEKL